MSKQFVISIMSKDRPGIIADITTVIYNLGGDLADLNQSVMGGYFSMILIAEFDKELSGQTISDGFSRIEADTAIEATIMEIKIDFELEKEKLPIETFVVTAQGENRKGMVKALGDFFYSYNINVLDLVTARENTLYTMIFQIDLTHIKSMKILRKELEQFGKDENLEIVLQHNDIYMATNEVGISLDTVIGN